MEKEFCLVVFPALHLQKVIIIGAGIVGEYCCKSCPGIRRIRKSFFDNSVYRFLKRLQNNIGHRLWTSVIETTHVIKAIKKLVKWR